MFRSLYLARRSAVHRLDPRTKIIGLLALSSLLFVFNHPLYVSAVALGVVGVMALARSLLNLYRSRYLLLLSLLLPLVMWQFFMEGPTVVGRVGPLVLTREALLFGVASGVRFSSLLLVGLLFASAVPVEEFLIGMVRLGVPYPVAFIFSLAVRLVPTFGSVLTTIVEAQVGRGLDLETRNPVRLTRNLVPLFVPFLVCAIRYGSQLSMALESKGFSISAKRTYVRELELRAADYWAFAFLLASAAACVALRVAGYGVIPNLET
ncbi:MAG TPA: energy-coupling factor transporter transmembrane component T [Pyrinomonadaceae bacterium]|nr:energy-coupling factor transporter transmembrane component T [Pyrinomonadaceae bacterium]